MNIYLSGEIHSDWRDKIKKACQGKGLAVTFSAPVTDHGASDAAGDVLGKEDNSYWRDHKSAKINAIRTQHAIKNSDLAVIRFGDKYRQWNVAFDAGFCAALGIPYITLHSSEIVHPLKEVDAGAQAWAQEISEVVDIIAYILKE